MYKNQIIVLIKKDGNPLRETDGKYVYLPFDSEYSIEIKNSSFRRAIASIKIDGTDIFGGNEVIIPAGQSVDIERFITDGDLGKGKKLKFVPLSNAKVSDPSSPENGLLEVEVWYEKLPIMWGNITTTATYPEGLPWYYSNSGGTVPLGRTVRASGVSNRGADSSVNYCASIGATTGAYFKPDSAHAGATVEGGQSNQSFGTASFGQKDYPSTIFKVWLRGVNVSQEVVSGDKVYCVSCGKKVRFDYKFCPRCGAPVQIA